MKDGRRTNPTAIQTKKMVSVETLDGQNGSPPTPEGRPHSGSSSELREISDEETAIVGVLAGDANTVYGAG